MHFHNGIISFLAFPAFFLSFCIRSSSGQTAEIITEEYRSDSIINFYARNYEFERALQVTDSCYQRALNNAESKAYWLLKAGNIFYTQGNMKSGNEMLSKAKDIILHLKNPGHLLQFHYAFLRGRYFYYAGSKAEALQWLRRAESHSMFLKKQNPIYIARLYGELGNIEYKHGEYVTAIRYYRLAIKTIPANSFPGLHEINCLKAKMADACWRAHEMGKSEMLVRNCIEYLDTTLNPMHPALMEAYLILYNYSVNFFDNYATSKKLLRSATLILEKYFPENHFYAGILYTKKGQLEYALSDFENALQYSRHALQILSKYSFLNQYKQLNYQNIARFYYWLERDYERTISFSKQAIDSLQHTGLSPADLYYMIGLSYRKLNNTSQAIENLKRVISLTSDNEKYHDNYECSNAYQQLGNIYLSGADYSACLKDLMTALAYAKRISPKGYAIININRDLGNAYKIIGDYQKALFYIQQSIVAGCSRFDNLSVDANPSPGDIALTLPLTRSLTDKAYALYMLYEKEGRPLAHLVNALQCQELAVSLIEKRVIDIAEERSGLIISDLRKRAMNNAVSYSVLLYLRTGEKQYAEKAWGYAEKSKMQVLSINAMKKNNLLYSGLPDSLIRKQENLKNEILNIENQLALDEKNENSEGSRSEALAKLARLYGQRDELTVRLEKDFPAYGRLKYKFAVADMSSIQHYLEKDQVLVEYQMLSTEIITFAITKSDFTIHFQLIDKQVSDNITRLRTAVSSNPLQSDPVMNYEAFVESSHYLYMKLIEPIYNKIKGKRLIIVPHDQLTQIPFEVLIRTQPENSKHSDYRSQIYLIREFPVAYSFSANLLIDRDQKKYGSGTAIFLPDYESFKRSKGRDSLLSSLQGAADESRAIRRLTGGRLYKQGMADESTFKARAHRYRILHIASHSLLDDTNPDLSYLAMTATSDAKEDDNLYSYEITQLELKAQLVVLSGCNTGYGILRHGEGLMSIARSFFYTGTRAVAYTLWPMADKAGSDLVSSFYKGLRHRQTLDKALRNAKLSFLEKADPVNAHPYYWAGYVVVGRTDPMPVFRLAFRMVILSASAAISILIFFLYRKFRA
jgi:CHAT domain-containing protein/tetratricopeptide (TPR) repeat protein